MTAPTAPPLRFGWAIRHDRAILRLDGREPARVLQGLLTNDIRRVDAGRALCALVLTPKGRPIADVRVWPPDEEGWTLDVPRAAQAALAEHLQRYVPPRLARWRWSEDATLLAIVGPDAALAVAELGLAPPPEDPVDAVTRAGADRCVASDLLGWPGYELLSPTAPSDRALDRLRSLGGLALADATVDRFQIAAGVPRFGAEWSERILPAEVLEPLGAVERWISFHKGCYTGQEVVVRVAHRGHVNRWLRGLRGTPPEPWAPGTPVRSAEGRALGWVTRAATAPWGGETIALCFVRREVAVGATVQVGEHAALLEALPFAAWRAWVDNGRWPAGL